MKWLREYMNGFRPGYRARKTSEIVHLFRHRIFALADQAATSPTGRCPDCGVRFQPASGDAELAEGSG